MAHHPDPNAPGSPAEPAELNGTELDIYPAGAGDTHHHHGHTIVAPSTLLGVLIALLALTLLTVGSAQLESVLMSSFNIVLPQWLNVAVALSIAVVKTALVVLFFMQLKYDNPLNSMVFIFTLITVAFFLGFTMVDLGGRGSIDRFKGEYVVPGGTGGVALPDGRSADANKPITEFVAAEAENPEHPLHHLWLQAHEHHDAPKRNVGFPLPEGAFKGSSSWQSRPVQGITLPGFAPEGAHDDHAPADHH